jgi:hypothetical protein
MCPCAKWTQEGNCLKHGKILYFSLLKSFLTLHNVFGHSIYICLLHQKWVFYRQIISEHIFCRRSECAEERKECVHTQVVKRVSMDRLRNRGTRQILFFNLTCASESTISKISVFKFLAFLVEFRHVPNPSSTLSFRVKLDFKTYIHDFFRKVTWVPQKVSATHLLSNPRFPWKNYQKLLPKVWVSCLGTESTKISVQYSRRQCYGSGWENLDLNTN